MGKESGNTSYFDFPELQHSLAVTPETAFVRDGDTLQQMGQRAGGIHSGILQRENKEWEAKAKSDQVDGITRRNVEPYTSLGKGVASTFMWGANGVTWGGSVTVQHEWAGKAPDP